MSYKDQYQFKSPDGHPDYSNLNYWAAHPWKWDPSDSIPAFLIGEKNDSSVDVFFLHPTMYTMKKKKKMNSDIDDDYLNAKTDYSTILYQASVFNQHARVFAPRYRQAHLSAYFTKDTIAALNAFQLAYEDVKASFVYYLENYNNGRPIIIASHSQGTTHALQLMKDFFDSTSLNKQLVAAYLVGMGIPKKHFSYLKFCNDSSSTGCFVGWRTMRRGYRPSYVKNDRSNSFVINPLTWRSDNSYSPRRMNEGSLLYKFNKPYRNTTDAWIDDDVLWVKRPHFPWSFLFLSRNYHAGDINLFYINIRKNVETRILHFLANQK